MSLSKPANPAAKYGQPNIKHEIDVGRFVKMAERVEDALITKSLHPEPKQLEPDRLLTGIYNRMGTSPNVRHVHYGILQSLLKNSFDRTRPAVGICVEYKSPEGIKKLLAHNQKFTKGNKLLPPIKDLQGPVYGTIACSHLNIALRCVKNGTYSPLGDLSCLLEQQTLKEAAINGHKWWILPEETPPELQMEISTWRNQDQNENQATSEIEILQAIKCAAQALEADGCKVLNKPDVVARAQRKNPARIQTNTWQTFASYFMGFVDNHVANLLEDLTEFHSTCVDPRELTVAVDYVNTIAKEEAFKACPHIRLHLVIAQYSKEKTRACGNGPAIAGLFETKEIQNFAKKVDQIQQVEQTIRDLKKKYLPYLEPTLGECGAQLEMATYISLILRSLFAKPWPADMDPKVTLPVGKFSAETIKAIGIHWAAVVDRKHPGIGFAEAAGLKPEEKGGGEDDDSQAVSVEGLKSLKRKTSDGPEPAAPKFKKDDEVTVINRMTWTVKTKDKPSFRKDIIEGTCGTIMGFADETGRQVLLKLQVTIDKKKVWVTQACFPKNLQKTSEYLLAKAAREAPAPAPEAPEAAGEGKDTDAKGKPPQWALGESEPGDVRMERGWSQLQADMDKLQQTSLVKALMFVGLHALYETLPKYNCKDFHVLHRRNEKGLWKSELWTGRAFQPYEILLAPHSSAIKETALMANLHAVVTLPKHGRGSHPSNQSLALDGRNRHLLAAEGSLDEEEHRGSLFWVVTRTPDLKKANLDFENLTWEQTNKVGQPTEAGKKRKILQADWTCGELPAFPTILNKKAIPKNTQLFVFLRDNKTKEPK